MEILSIDNLMVRYKKKFVYDKFNLKVEKGSWITIAGPNGAGKTTLIKVLSGIIKTHADIKIFGKKYNKLNSLEIRKEIGFVFENPENYFVAETVEDELAFSLENIAVRKSMIKKKLEEISTLLNIKSLLKCSPLNLSGGEKQKVALASALMLEPRILILDELLSMLDSNEQVEMLEILKKINKEKRITIISLTNNLDETLYSDRLIILNDGKIIIDGSFPEIFEEERIMRKIGLEVPFMIELNRKLKLYKPNNNFNLDMRSLVVNLWK
ncbi:MAG: ATP-binding cassette domain-containing protein [Bacilli bacterium]